MSNKDISLCKVELDGDTFQAAEFVAVLSKENGDLSIAYNADALTLGKAASLILNAFVDCLRECSAETVEEIADILGINGGTDNA